MKIGDTTFGERRRAATPPPYHHGNLRESLLAAADSLLTEHGATGITLRDLAKAAGVSHAPPYHHFASLNALLAAVDERAFNRLGDAMTAAVAAQDPQESLLQISIAYERYARSHPAQFPLMFGPLMLQKNRYPAFNAAAEKAFDTMLATACALDQANGPDLALSAWSLSHGLSNLMIDGAFDGMPLPTQDPDTLVRRITQCTL